MDWWRRAKAVLWRRRVGFFRVPFAKVSAAIRSPLVILALLVLGLVQVGSRVIGRRTFPADTTPEGAYARIALAVADRRPQDAFAYLETEAQWASFTVLDLRQKASQRVRASYPPDEQARLLAAWKDEASAKDGADEFARLAAQRGWIGRLERDLSGAAHVETEGERATVVTARGTRYPFRRRENGIWGLTIFTAELGAEAEKAQRDLSIVERAAADYERTKPE
jgi:hypothetical protein